MKHVLDWPKTISPSLRTTLPASMFVAQRRAE
jgi:hypothetical protein